MGAGRKKPAVRGTQTLDRAMDIIFALARAEKSMPVAAIAAAVGLPESTAYRLIQALEEKGLLERHRWGQVGLGLRVLELSRVVYHQVARDLHRAARPVLEQLCRDTGQTAVLMVRTGAHAICLDSVAGPHPQRLAFESGRLLPLHLGASNKALLAHLPPAVVEEALAEAAGGEAARPVDREALLAELAAIRSRGYAHTRGELDPDAVGIGVPVLDPHGKAVASLSLVGARAAFSPETVARGVQLLQAGAAAVRAGLAGRPA